MNNPYTQTLLVLKNKELVKAADKRSLSRHFSTSQVSP